MNLLALQTLDINRSIASAPSQKTQVQARPVFPNSLLSTEVRVMLSTSDSSNSSHRISTSVKKHNSVLDYPIDNSLHYRLQDPLPDYLGKQLYRAGAHIVGIFEDESNLLKVDSELVCLLHSIINTDQITDSNLKTQFFIDSDTSEFNTLKNQSVNSLAINIRRLSHVSHRLSVIGKASLVLCDSPGIAVDAIRSMVPVALVGDMPIEFEKLQNSIETFLHHRNFQQLLAEQQCIVEGIVQSRCQHNYVMSNLSTMHDLLAANLTLGDANTEMSCLHGSVTEVQTQCDLILSSQQLLFSNSDKTIRLKSGLESSRRKLQKFKESPVRFIEDSQSRLLKPFSSSKTPP